MLVFWGKIWTLLGLGAVTAAVCGLLRALRGEDAAWCSFISLSLTALTLCAFHSQDAVWVLGEDWSALMDVIPAMSPVLWVLTLASIAVNGFSLFRSRK